MTRGQLITRALRLSGDTSLVLEARDALDDILLKIESIGYWGFLYYSDTNAINLSVVSNVYGPFTLPIDGYAKGISISLVPDTHTDVYPRALRRISHEEMQSLPPSIINSTVSDEGPSFFSVAAIRPLEMFVHIWPAITGSYGYKVSYFHKMVLPSSDDQELSSGGMFIPIKYHPYLIDGVAAIMALQGDDDKANLLLNSFIAGLQIMIQDNAAYYPKNVEQLGYQQLQAIFRRGN